MKRRYIVTLLVSDDGIPEEIFQHKAEVGEYLVNKLDLDDGVEVNVVFSEELMP